jgi:hypothetical protein
MYVLMLYSKEEIVKVEAGIISFKNLKSGFLKLAATTAQSNGKKDFSVYRETLDSFEIELKKLILEICDSEIPFTEKEINSW